MEKEQAGDREQGEPDLCLKGSRCGRLEVYEWKQREVQVGLHVNDCTEELASIYGIPAAWNGAGLRPLPWLLTTGSSMLPKFRSLGCSVSFLRKKFSAVATMNSETLHKIFEP
jgi:hypothetical protein